MACNGFTPTPMNCYWKPPFTGVCTFLSRRRKRVRPTGSSANLAFWQVSSIGLAGLSDWTDLASSRHPISVMPLSCSQLFPHCLIMSDTAQTWERALSLPKSWGNQGTHVSLFPSCQLSRFSRCVVTPLPPGCGDIQETTLLQLAMPSASLSLLREASLPPASLPRSPHVQSLWLPEKADG